METIKQLVRRVLQMRAHERRVKNVLKAFEHMGADREELARERQRLESDDMYLAEWIVAVNPPRGKLLNE